VDAGSRQENASKKINTVLIQSEPFRLSANGRRVGATQPEVLVADLNAIKEGKQKDLMLEPYDIVEVGKQGETFGSFMTKLITGLPNRIPIPIP